MQFIIKEWIFCTLQINYVMYKQHISEQVDNAMHMKSRKEYQDILSVISHVCGFEERSHHVIRLVFKPIIYRDPMNAHSVSICADVYILSTPFIPPHQFFYINKYELPHSQQLCISYYYLAPMQLFLYNLQKNLHPNPTLVLITT